MLPPKFQSDEPLVATCAENEPLALSVDYPSGDEPIQFEWRRWSGGAEGDGEEEPVGARYSSHQSDGRAWLCAESASSAHAGAYVLRATNAAGAAKKRVLLDMQPGSQLVIIDHPPAFVRRLTDLAVKVGTRTRLLVEIASTSDVEVVWYRNDRRLMEADRFRIFRDGRFFCVEVSPVTVEDGGRWTCTAENCGGHSSCSAHLNVLVPKAYKRPEFLEELRALLTEQGTVSLECKVVGVPTPALRWFKDSKEIKAGDVFALTANPDDPTSLGTYTCEAVNCMGKTYSSSEVHVVGRGSREGSLKPADNLTSTEPPPIFTKELEDQSLKVGEKLTLNCQIVVPPWPKTVTWYNKEGRIESSERYRVLEDGLGGYMVEVPSSEWADEGEWKCVATSNEGRVGISTSNVSMAVPKNYRKPRFMENLKAVLTEEGLVSFECKVVGFPTPLLSWFKDGQELKPGDVYQLTGTNSLGSYCCIARNCMGQASSSAELTVEDIQNQLNDEERLQLFSKNQAPKFIQVLKSQEAKINENFRFTVKVSFIPEPSLFWYRDDQPIEDSMRYKIVKEPKGICHLDIQQLEFMDQAEWKCFATNDFGHSVTSCFLKLIIPRYFKKPRFLENLRAILSEEGAVNLECKVIGVPQPILKWYKDGEELKPGDIHRIISGQDGTCCLGTYTCEAQNCMGIAASSASLLGFEDTVKASKANKKVEPEPLLQRNISLSTIHEERTSQMYDTPVGDVTLDEKGEISFSFDGKEVSVSLYETPDLTEEEALQIIEMYADQLSENVTEHNVVELPPLRFVKETSTSGNLLMEAILIDVSPDYFMSAEEDMRTEADVDDMSIIEEPGAIANESFATPDILEIKTEEALLLPKRPPRKKSESAKSGEDFFSISKENVLSVDSASEQQSFASLDRKEESGESKAEAQKDSSKKAKKELEVVVNVPEETMKKLVNLSKVYNVVKSHLQAVEEEVIMQAAKMSSAAAANKSLEIIASIHKPVEELQAIIKNIQDENIILSEESLAEAYKTFIDPIKNLHDSLAIVEKCVEMGGKSQTLVQRTSVCLIETLGKPMQNALNIIKDVDVILEKHITATNHREVDILVNDMITGLKMSEGTIKSTHLIQQATELNGEALPMNKQLKDKVKDKSAIVQNIWKPVLKLENSVETIKNNICLDKNSSNVDIQMNEYIMDLITKPIQELQIQLENIEQAAVQESQENLYEINTAILETLVQPMFHLRNGLDSMSNQTQTVVSIVEDLLSSIVEIKSGLAGISDKFDVKVIEPFEKSQKTIQQMARNLLALQTHINDSNVDSEIIPQYNEVQNELFKILESAVQMSPTDSTVILEPLVQPTSMLNESFDLLETKGVKVFAQASVQALEMLRVNMANMSEIKIADVKQNLQSAILSAEKLEIKVKASESAQSVAEQNQVAKPQAAKLIAVKKEDKKQKKAAAAEGQKKQKAEEVLMKNIADNILKTVTAMEEKQVSESAKDLSEKEAMGPLKQFALKLLEFKDTVAAVEFAKETATDSLASMADFSVSQTLAKPLYQLNQCFNLADEICLEAEENRTSKREVSLLKTLAKPLFEFHNELQVVQNELYSQICDKSATAVPNPELVKQLHDLEECLLQIQQQIAIEATDDLSTLGDISAIKTTAETAQDAIETAMFMDQNVVLESTIPVIQEKVETYEIKPMQKLLQSLSILQQPQIIEMLNDLSDKEDMSQLKTLPKCMLVLQKSIESIQQPLQLESTLKNSQILSLEESLQELKSHVDMIQSCDSIKVDTKAQKLISAISEPIQDMKQSILQVEKVELKQLKAKAKASIEGDYIGITQQVPEPYDALADMSTATDISALKTLAGPLQDLRVAVAAIQHDKAWDMFETIEDDKVKPPLGQKLGIALQELLTGIATVQKNLIRDSAESLKVEETRESIAKPLQELYKCIATVQQNLVNEPQDEQKSMTDFAYTSTLAETLETVQKCIAVLEQHDLVDLSCVSDLQLPMDVESEKYAKATADQALIDQKEVIQNVIAIMADIEKNEKQVNFTLKNKIKSIKNQIVKAQDIFAQPVEEILKKKQELAKILSESEGAIQSIESENLLTTVKNDKVKQTLENSMEVVKGSVANMKDTLKKVNNYNKQLVFNKPIKTIKTFAKQIDILHFSASAEHSVSQELIALVSMIVPLKEVCHKFEIADLSSEPLAGVEEVVVSATALKECFSTVQKSASVYKQSLTQMVVDDSSAKITKESALEAVDELCHSIENRAGAQNYQLLQTMSVPLKVIGDFLMEQLMKDKKDSSQLESSKLDIAQVTEPIRNLQECLAVVQKQLLECADEDTLASEMSLVESYAEPILELQKELSAIEEQIPFMGDVACLSEQDKILIKTAEVTIHDLKENISAIQETLQGSDVSCLKALTSPLSEVEEQLSILTVDDDSKSFAIHEANAVLVDKAEIEQKASIVKIDSKKEKGILNEIEAKVGDLLYENIKELNENQSIVEDIPQKSVTADQEKAKAIVEGFVGLEQQVAGDFEALGDISTATDPSLLKTLAAPLEELRVAVAAIHQDKAWDMFETIDDDKVRPPISATLNVALQELLTGIATVQKSLVTDSTEAFKVQDMVLESAAIPLQELYKCIATVQQNLVNEPQDDQKSMTDFTYTATLAESLETVQKCFAVLEQHDLVDLSCVSDLQLPVDVESEKFAKATADQALVDQKDVIQNVIAIIANIESDEKQVNVILNDKIKLIKNQIVKAQEIFTEPVEEILKKKHELAKILSESEGVIISVESESLLATVKNDKVKKSLETSIEAVKSSVVRMKETLNKINNYNKQVIFSKPIKTIKNFTKQIDILHFSASAERSITQELVALESMIAPLREVCHRFELADLSSENLADVEDVVVPTSVLKGSLFTVKKAATTYKKSLVQITVDDSSAKISKQQAMDAIDELCNSVENKSQVQNYQLLQSMSAPLKIIGDFLIEQLMKNKKDSSELESSKMDVAEVAEPIRNLQECLAVVQNQLLQVPDEDTLSCDVSFAESYAELKQDTELADVVQEKAVEEKIHDTKQDEGIETKISDITATPDILKTEKEHSNKTKDVEDEQSVDGKKRNDIEATPSQLVVDGKSIAEEVNKINEVEVSDKKQQQEVEDMETKKQKNAEAEANRKLKEESQKEKSDKEVTDKNKQKVKDEVVKTKEVDDSKKIQDEDVAKGEAEEENIMDEKMKIDSIDKKSSEAEVKRKAEEEKIELEVTDKKKKEEKEANKKKESEGEAKRKAEEEKLATEKLDKEAADKNENEKEEAKNKKEADAEVKRNAEEEKLKKEKLEKEAAEKKKQVEEEAKTKTEADAQAKIKSEEDKSKKAAADKNKKEDDEAEKKIEADAETKRKADEEKLNKEKLEKEAADKKKQEEEEAKKKTEVDAEAKCKAEEEKLNKEKLEKDVADRKKKEDEEAKKNMEADAEATRKSEEEKLNKEKLEKEVAEKNKQEEEEAKKKTEVDAEAKRKAEEKKMNKEKLEKDAADKKKKDEEAKKKTEADAEVKRKAEEEKLKKDKLEKEVADKKKQEEDEAKNKTEADAQAKLKAEEEKLNKDKLDKDAADKKKKDEEAKKKTEADAEAKRKREEEQLNKEKLEKDAADKKKKEDEDAKKKTEADAEANRKADEEKLKKEKLEKEAADKKKQEEEETKKKMEADAQAKLKAEEEKVKEDKLEKDAADKKKKEEEESKKKKEADAEAKRKVEEEQLNKEKLEKETADKNKQEEDEAKKKTEADAQAKLKAEEEKLKNEKLEKDVAEKKKKEDEEAKKKKKADAADAEAKRKVEEEKLNKEKLEKEAADKNKQEEDEAKKKTEADAQAKLKAEEEKLKNEKLEKDAAEKKKKEDEEAKKKKKADAADAEAKRKVKEEKLNKEKLEKEASDKKKQEEEEAKKTEVDAQAKLKAEEEKFKKEKLEKDAADKKKKEDEEAKKKTEADAQAKLKAEEEKLKKEKLEKDAANKKKKEDEEAKKKTEADAQAKLKAEEEKLNNEKLEKDATEKKKKEDEEAKKKKKADAEAKRKVEEEKLNNEKLDKEASDKKKQEEEEAKKNTEVDAEAKLKAEEEKLKNEKLEKDAADKKKKEDEEAKKKAEADAQTKLKAEEAKSKKEKLEKDAADKKKKEDEETKKNTEADADAKRKAEEEKLKKEKLEKEAFDKKKKEEDEAKKKTEADALAKLKTEEEKLKKEKLEKEAADKKKKEEEEIKKKAEADAQAKLKAEKEKLKKEKLEKDAADKKKKEEEEIKKKTEADADAKLKAEEEKLKKEKLEKEASDKKKQEEDEAKKKTEADALAKLKTEEEKLKKEKLEKDAADKKKKEEEEIKKKAEADAQAKLKAEKEKLKKEKLEKDAADKKKKEEEEIKKKTEADADAKLKAEEEKLKKEKLEKEASDKKKQEEDEAKKKTEADALAKLKTEEEKLKKEKLEKDAADKKKKVEEEVKKKAEADAQAKLKAEEEKLKKEKFEKDAADKKKKEHEEAKRKAEEEKLKKEKLAKETADKKKKEEDEAKKKAEADAQAKLKAEEEKLKKEKLEKDAADKKKKEDEEAKKKKEADAEAKRKAEEEKLKKEKLAKESADKKKQEEDEAKKKTEADAQAKLKAEEEKLKKEKLEKDVADKKKKEEDEAKKKAEADAQAKLKAEEEKLKKEKLEKDAADKKKKEDEEAKKKKEADAEAKRKAEEAKLNKEKLEKDAADKKKKEDEEAKKKAEADAQTKLKAEEAKSKKEKLGKDAADKKKKEDEEAKKNTEADAQVKLNAEEEKLKKDKLEKECEDQKKQEEALAKKMTDSETKRKAGEDKIKKEKSDKELTEKKELKKKEKGATAKIKKDEEDVKKKQIDESDTKQKSEEETLKIKQLGKGAISKVGITNKDKTYSTPLTEVGNNLESQGESIQTFTSESKATHRTFDQLPPTGDTGKPAKDSEVRRKISREESSRKLKPGDSPTLRRNEKESSLTDSSRSSTLKSETTSSISKYSSSSRDLKKKPVFCTNLTDRTAVEGSRVKLTCSVLGSPEPTIEWYQNGVILRDQNKYRTKFCDGLCTLEVLNAVPSDSADYNCTAKNENGTASSSARLKVYAGFESTPIPPTFTRSIKDTYHVAEDELVLECRIRGHPIPTITWMKDARVLGSDSRYSMNYLADGVCRLIINHPNQSDAGKYTCKAENSMWCDQIYHDVYFAGRDQYISTSPQHFETLRYARAQHDARRPHFSTILSDHSVPSGGTIALQVHVMGSPEDVQWLKGDEPIMPDRSRVRTFTEKGLYTLALADVSEREAGKYTCRAINAFGKVDMDTSVIVVSPGSLRVGKTAFMVSRPEPDISVYAGEDISMACRAQGDPKPKMTWMKGMHDITNSRRSLKQISDDYYRFTLKRAVASDAGTYCIMAKNSYGCDRTFVTVVVRERETYESSDQQAPGAGLNYTDVSYLRDVPGPISSEPVVVDGGRNWVSLWWGKPVTKNSAPVLAYKVEAWLSGGEGGARWAELGISPINSFDAFSLKTGSEYLFRVTPKNRYGWGESKQTMSSVIVGKIVCLPEFTKTLPGQMKALIDQSVTLRCKVKGDPTPTVKWHKDGTEIERNNRMSMRFVRGECSLTINKVTGEDMGRYMCEAIHRDGRASSFVRLQVVVDPNIWEADDELKRRRDDDFCTGECAPQFTMRLRDRRVQVTYPVRLTCQVIGKPTPTVSWTKNGLPILQEDDRFMFGSDDQFHTLEISQSTLSDSGYYSATASNARGSVSCRSSLVVDKGIRAYISPDFFCGLEPQSTVREGEELRLSACVEAYPSVGIAWHRDGIKLRPSRRAVMTLDHDGGVELALANVTIRDAGIYTCTATNEVGKCSTSTKVVVKEEDDTGATFGDRVPPSLISPDAPYSKEPMFVKKPRSSDAMEGDTVIILCEVTGDPKPEVMWLRDFLKPEYYRDARQFKRVGAGPEYRLLIPHAKLDHTGAYSVIARNCHGEAKAVISLQIYTKGLDDNMDRTIRTGKVEVLPFIKQELKNIRCCDGDTISLECRVKGTPEPTVKWEKDGVPVPNGGDFKFEMDRGIARLIIETVYPEDEGMYTCIASNALGKSYTSSCLVVDVPEEKENLLSQQLVRPPVLISAGSTPRSTPCRSPSPSPVRRQRESVSQTRSFRTSRWKLCPPKFYAVPFNKVCEEGETVVFRCSIAGHPVPWVVWDKDGVEVTPSPRITIKEHDEDRILQITDVTVEDAGLYKVTVDNEVGRVEANARLEIIKLRGSSSSGLTAYHQSKDSLAFRRKLSNSSARPGDDLTLKSEVRNYNTKVQSKWYKDGHVVSMSDVVFETRKTSKNSVHISLTIKSANSSHKGTYTLVLSDSHGDISSWADVDVISDKNSNASDLLKIVDHLSPVQAYDGDTISMVFKLAASKSFDFTWMKNGKVVPDCDYYQYMDYGNGVLGLIVEDIFHQDEGVYSCQVSNKYRSCSTSCQVTVRDDEYNTCRTDDFSLLPRPITVEEGKMASFEVKIRPNLKCKQPDVLWEVNGVRVKSCDTHFEMSSSESTHTLKIRNAHRNDSGVVRCAVHSDADSDLGLPYESFWCTTNLAVVPSVFMIENMQINLRKPGFMSNIGEVRSVGGRAVVVKAPFRSELESTIRWIAADGEIITNGKKYQIETGPAESCLSIKNAGKCDSGKYRVEVENRYGIDSQAFSVIVAGEPDVPLVKKASKPQMFDDDANLSLFNSKYKMYNIIGRGKFGTVKLVVNSSTNEKMAAKFVKTFKPTDKENVIAELEIMHCLEHPKLIKFIEAYVKPSEMIIITEYISGGELFERVSEEDFTLTERDCALFMSQICEGVKFMHDNNIVHLDLKPENIMCQTRPSQEIKIIDFGLSKRLRPNEEIRVFCGTPEFIAPEVINFDPISKSSDMWSIGVICYVLLSGLSPFSGDTLNETYSNILQVSYDFEDAAFDNITSDAKEFIDNLLIRRMEDRHTAAQCLQSKWILQHRDKRYSAALCTDKLKKYVYQSKWQITRNAIRAVRRMVSLSTITRLNANKLLSNGSKESSKMPSICEAAQSMSNSVDNEAKSKAD
ncbi:uncharacterized protein LOC143922796 [Arctopsyche grandis]|uniref:uncharacterized protein LOC143922796 n=1 Tax=Arctopsyche grandis TaxID=121162 RepID=UPI00406DA1A2